MRCTSCNAATAVLDSRTRATDGAVRRRRECKSCGRRFTTEEWPQAAWLGELPESTHESGGPLETVRRRAILAAARDENDRQRAEVGERLLGTMERMLALADKYGLKEEAK
jgi:hypothetical protein